MKKKKLQKNRWTNYPTARNKRAYAYVYKTYISTHVRENTTHWFPCILLFCVREYRRRIRFGFASRSAIFESSQAFVASRRVAEMCLSKTKKETENTWTKKHANHHRDTTLQRASCFIGYQIDGDSFTVSSFFSHVKNENERQ